MQKAIFLFLLLILASGCKQDTQSTNNDTIITPGYWKNISTLFGYGYKLAPDSTKNTPVSDIVWKDSLGIERHLTDLKGKIVVLNFWADWCPPCHAEAPGLESTYLNNLADSVVFIGVSIDHSGDVLKTVQNFVASNPTKYQLILDPDFHTYINYGGETALPMTFVIDRDGYITYKQIGQMYPDILQNYIDNLK
jgi:peroxiredoxin